MTQISKYKLSENIKKQIDNFFYETLAKLTTKEQIKEFLTEFFTKNENIIFSKRLAIGILISRGVDYRNISRILKVSTATVTKSAVLYNSGTSYRKMVDEIDIRLNRKKFLLGLGEDIASIGAVGGAKSAGWFSTKNELRKKKNDIF